MAGKKKVDVSNYAGGALGGTLGGRTNLGLGSLRGAGVGAERKRRMDSYLESATGDSSYRAPKKAAKKKGR